MEMKAVLEVPFNRDEVTKIFKKHDKDNNGKLSWDEVKAAFVEFKSKWPSVRTELAFRRADNNDDGSIDMQDQEWEKLVGYVLSCEYTKK
jgi:Ca2+-binding EF-hand superfamily protein